MPVDLSTVSAPSRSVLSLDFLNERMTAWSHRWPMSRNRTTSALTARTSVIGGDTGAAEPVKDFETALGYLFCMSVSRDGSLIHATVGSLGGLGRRLQNRVGFAV